MTRAGVRIEIWSDIHCPWATLATHRLRKARDELGFDATFDQRPWPLEWVNGRGTPRDIVAPETAVLSTQEPALYNRYANASWPSTFLPAFEVVAAARRVGGLRLAEDADFAMRRAFFTDSTDVSIRSGLQSALEAADLPADDILTVWDTEPVRADVVADYERSKSLPIQGSPQIFWPDGTTDHNPGMSGLEWVGGLPRLREVDADAPRRLLASHMEGERT